MRDEKFFLSSRLGAQIGHSLVAHIDNLIGYICSCDTCKPHMYQSTITCSYTYLGILHKNSIILNRHEMKFSWIVKRARGHLRNTRAAHVLLTAEVWNYIELYTQLQFTIILWRLTCHFFSFWYIMPTWSCTVMSKRLILPPLPKISDILRIYGVRAKKQLSQNFILDQNITGMYQVHAGTRIGGWGRVGP